MKLTKRVPARTVNFEAEQCSIDFLTMSPRYRSIRAKSRNKMTSCHWCKYAFVDGEMMSLAITRKGNKVLCRTCAEQLLPTKEDQ